MKIWFDPDSNKEFHHLFSSSQLLHILFTTDKMTWMWRVLFFSFFCFFVLSIPAGYKRLTCGFKLAKMHLDAPFREEWEVSQEIDGRSILSQPFTYLGRGAQSYVFLSNDGRFVIKFFRFDRMRRDHEKKIGELFRACILAYTKAKEQTGAVYLHLNRTENVFPHMELTGPLGQKMCINPDEYRFVIQKKVSSFKESILNAPPELVRKRLDSFFSLLKTRLDKGIHNSDPDVIRNFGFLGESAIEIDFGNYSERGTSKEKEFAHYTRKLRSWLKENAAEWLDYFDERIACNS